MTIWKFPVEAAEQFRMLLPAGAQFLSVQVQEGTPHMWWMVDRERPDETRRFRVFGTGHPVQDPGSLMFLGTFQVAGGRLVFHLFEER